ncbi:hypothetical protein CRE_21304 [Caenorhabditis remanei]|uniref:Uncharacterized protein n=1 Tax=Caenorhabditis remanei TaxID=31234 RepID=E3MUL2_CAERE|nr:hypothetical protein CRE_21304 [Caenorhabditis remanei]
MYNQHEVTFHDKPSSFHPSWGRAPSFYPTNQQSQAQPFKCLWNTDGKQSHKYFLSLKRLGFHVKEEHATHPIFFLTGANVSFPFSLLLFC